MTEWRSIETAPKDGSRVLLWTETDEADPYVRVTGAYVRTIQIGKWDEETYGGSPGWTKELIGDPLFWMPLPNPPQPIGENE